MLQCYHTPLQLAHRPHSVIASGQLPLWLSLIIYVYTYAF